MSKRIVAIFAGALFVTALGASRASAQDPVLTPIIASEAAPIIVSAVKPKPKNTGLAKYQGYIMNATTSQITVKALGDDMAVKTFPLSEAVSAKMQTIIDNGGYQYGDKVKIEYDPSTLKVVKLKGKPSKSL
jgi:hypothetical protein